MAVVSDTTDTRYWRVTDTDARSDGKFDINLKQVADAAGTPMPTFTPAARRTITRNQDVTVGTIVLVEERTVVDRTFTVNPPA